MIRSTDQYLQFKLSSYIKAFRNSVQYQATADRQALTLFHAAAERVPAYQQFLHSFKINPGLIKTVSDFRSVPYTTKENYIARYSLADRCWDGRLNSTHMFAASSGSTGEPTFWPRGIEQDLDGALLHEYFLEKLFHVRDRSTLFINSFGLGNWIAGMYTQSCLYVNRLKQIPFTLANPGYNQDETFKVVKQFSQFFDQTIIACHPPILKMMIENGKKESIDWEKLHVRFLGAGEGFSENWRDYLLSLVHQTNPLDTMFNIYGSADAGLMGFETPLSIALRRVTATNHALNQLLFSNERNPYLYQFDPTMRYLESIDGEITITMDSTMPLLRYNIKDKGGVIAAESVLDTVGQHFPKSLEQIKKRISPMADFLLPFVYIFGRDRFMTTLYGVNMYPENIKAVVEHPDLQPYLTGRFISEKLIDDNQDQALVLRVELKPNKRKSKTLINKLHAIFVATLKELNSEYNQVEAKFGSKMHPRLRFHRFHHPEFFAEGVTKKMS